MKAIEQFHRSGRRCVIAVTGGGTRLISDLLAVPGGSATILEAIVPYSENSLARFLKRSPDQYCAAETALAMAAAAFQRARLLDEQSEPRSLGVGITASLASTRPKRGDHRAYLAMQNADETALVSITLAKNARTRTQEETFVASQGLALLRRGAGLADDDSLADETDNAEAAIAANADDVIQMESVQATDDWRSLRNFRKPFVVSGQASNDGQPLAPPPVLLSGSFNPLHHGHTKLRDAAADFLGANVGFEFPIINADKPPLDDISLKKRLQQFDEPVVLTALPTFVEKARELPRTTFVVGIDTAVRVLNAKFYSSGTLDDAMATVRHQECRFLVAARHDHGEVITLGDLNMPKNYVDLFVELPAENFLEDVSSTALRCG